MPDTEICVICVDGVRTRGVPRAVFAEAPHTHLLDSVADLHQLLCLD